MPSRMEALAIVLCAAAVFAWLPFVVEYWRGRQRVKRFNRGRRK